MGQIRKSPKKQGVQIKNIGTGVKVISLSYWKLVKSLILT